MDYDDGVTPTVMWHGMGDSCCNFFSMGRIKRLIEKEVPGVFVYSICIGREIGQCNIVSDTLDGFLGNVSAQVDYACETIKQYLNWQMDSIWLAFLRVVYLQELSSNDAQKQR